MAISHFIAGIVLISVVSVAKKNSSWWISGKMEKFCGNVVFVKENYYMIFSELCRLLLSIEKKLDLMRHFGKRAWIFQISALRRKNTDVFKKRATKSASQNQKYDYALLVKKGLNNNNI